jgi:radical SAM/Cys-rich protein
MRRNKNLQYFHFALLPYSHDLPMLSTTHLLYPTSFPTLSRGPLQTLQVNLGYRCNQSCVHCHVGAGPQRPEQMDAATAELVLAFLAQQDIATLDLTGGAPELNPQFRRLVMQARAAGLRVLDRCNLTVLSEPGQEDLVEFLADQQVEVVASLPCYLEHNVDQQRGRGVFATSIAGLRRLNALGYGAEGSGLLLSLVYNPQGPVLPPPQCSLEQDYRRELGGRYGVQFNQLLTLTNMPIQRFGSMLQSQGRFQEYLQLLRTSHRPENLPAVMCRSLVSVDWQGYLYDCDFNQMLDLGLEDGGRRAHLRDWLERDFSGRPVRVAEHCFGCTAGQGSGCSGALS